MALAEPGPAPSVRIRSEKEWKGICSSWAYAGNGKADGLWQKAKKEALRPSERPLPPGPGGTSESSPALPVLGPIQRDFKSRRDDRNWLWLLLAPRPHKPKSAYNSAL